jgi:hypothetical protein
MRFETPATSEAFDLFAEELPAEVDLALPQCVITSPQCVIATQICADWSCLPQCAI